MLQPREQVRVDSDDATMSRYEYQYTRDPLGTNLTILLILYDLQRGRFKTNAKHLGMSPVLMNGYMEVALMALQEALPDSPSSFYRQVITNFQPSKIRGQREIGIPRRKKGDPKPKPIKTDPKIIAPTPGFKLSHLKADLPRKVTFTERPFAGRFAIRLKVKATASSDGRIPELTIHVGHRASGDYDPKKIMGREMVEPSKGEYNRITGNIEDFPLGKKTDITMVAKSQRYTSIRIYMEYCRT